MTNTHRPSVSALIPTFNGRHLLKKFLPSVFKSLRSKDELIIIDDASTDETIAYLIATYSLRPSKKITFKNNYSTESRTGKLLKNTYKLYTGTSKHGGQTIDITLVALKKNHRFGKAVNIGALFANHDYLLVLNNDVQPEPECVLPALQPFADPHVFGVGFLEYQDVQKKEASGKNRLWFEKGLFRHSRAAEMTAGETAWVSGGSGVFRTDLWFRLQGFDPDFYPAYWEDIDLSYRAQQLGLRTVFEPQAIVFHHHETTHKTTFGDTKMLEVSWKNAQLFTEKHASLYQKILYYIYKPYLRYQFTRFLQQHVANSSH